ncbi:hypothetical protein ACFYZ8_34220 [Streptomyces sp. NPDC001668]|uniref:hypothetical protein n=1 Tax=Streptomyces sp. NPDC001668 TaxID=3364598 RepID=UPI0036C1CE2B
MTKTKRALAAGLAAVLLLTGSGCSDRSAGATTSPASSASPQSTDKVAGLRDDLRHVTRKVQHGTRPRLVRTCTKPTLGKRKSRTRTCTWVRRGTEPYTRVVRPERFCVELDNVNGEPTRDDIWFEVDRATYTRAQGVTEGDRIAFEALASGC